MKPIRFLVLLGFALAIVSAPLAVARAQDATPPATPEVSCAAPALSSDMSSEGMASPEAAGMDTEAAAPPVAEGPASRNLAQMGEDALNNLLACLEGGDFEGAAALLTPNMWMFVSGSPDPADTVAAFEAQPPAPMEIANIGTATIDTNNRVGLPLVFGGFFNSPGTQVAEKWYFVKDGAYWKLDEIVPTTIPADLYPDATVLNIHMVDFAFALDQNSIPSGPVIFHVTNTSYSGQPHVAAMVSLSSDISAEDLIQATALPDDQVTAFIGAVFLMPGQTGDFYVENLAPGQYTLACDVSTPDGTPHWQLGMVAKLDVV